MVLYVYLLLKMMLNESNWSNHQLHIFGERKETVKFLKELLGCYLCVALGHTYTRMSEHLAHRFDGYALFKLMSVAKVCRAICVIKGKEIQESLQLYFECFSEELWSEP